MTPPKRLVSVPSRIEAIEAERFFAPEVRPAGRTAATPEVVEARPTVQEIRKPFAPLDQTRLLIGELWSTAEFDTEVTDEPAPISESLLDKRGWARRAGALLLVVGAALLGWGFYSLWTGRPVDMVTESAARADLTAALVDLRPVLADFADGAPIDQAATPLAIDRVSTAAKRLFTAAAGIDDPTARNRATTDAQLVLDVTETLSRIDSYQAALTPVLLGPDVASASDEIQMAELLASWQSEFENAVSVLPAGPVTRAIDQELATFDREFDLWKGSMLDVLREGQDIEPLTADLGSRLEVIRSHLDALLEDTATDAASRIAQLS